MTKLVGWCLTTDGSLASNVVRVRRCGLKNTMQCYKSDW